MCRCCIEMLQLYVIWIVVHMENVTPENANAITDGPVADANNFHVTLVVKNMDSVVMALVFVRKDGTDDIALYVSRLYISYFTFFFFGALSTISLL